jgi:GntR family transcriptional regulator, transcriptional repressor for pyruvate dehydrogenase complex
MSRNTERSSAGSATRVKSRASRSTSASDGQAKTQPSLPLAERNAVVAVAVERIQGLIRSGQLRAGHRLPGERQLATQLGLSRSSLREALRALAQVNVLVARRGAGTYVTSLEPALLVEPVHFLLELDDSALTQLFEVRQAIEPSVARLAAHRATSEDLDALAGSLRRLSELQDDLGRFLDEDMAFHTVILNSVRNPLLSRLVESIQSLGLMSRRRTVQIRGVPERTIADHNAIYQALLARDPQGSSDRMFDHLQHVQVAFMQSRASSGHAGPGNPIELSVQRVNQEGGG